MTSLTPPGMAPPPSQISPLTASSLSMAPIGTSMSVSPAGIGISPVKPVGSVLPVTPGSSGLVNPVPPLSSGSPGLINPASPHLLPMTSGLASPAAPMPSLVNPQLGPPPPIGLQRNLFPPHHPPPLPMHQPPPPPMFGPVQQPPPALVPHSTMMTVPAAPTQYVQQMQPAVVYQQPATHYAPQPQLQVLSPHQPTIVQTVPVVQPHYVPQPAPPTQYVVAVPPPPPPPPPPLPPSIMSVHYPPVGPTTYTRLRY